MILETLDVCWKGGPRHKPLVPSCGILKWSWKHHDVNTCGLYTTALEHACDAWRAVIWVIPWGKKTFAAMCIDLVGYGHMFEIDVKVDMKIAPISLYPAPFPGACCELTHPSFCQVALTLSLSTWLAWLAMAPAPHLWWGLGMASILWIALVSFLK